MPAAHSIRNSQTNHNPLLKEGLQEKTPHRTSSTASFTGSFRISATHDGQRLQALYHGLLNYCLEGNCQNLGGTSELPLLPNLNEQDKLQINTLLTTTSIDDLYEKTSELSPNAKTALLKFLSAFSLAIRFEKLYTPQAHEQTTPHTSSTSSLSSLAPDIVTLPNNPTQQAAIDPIMVDLVLTAHPTQLNKPELLQNLHALYSEHFFQGSNQEEFTREAIVLLLQAAPRAEKPSVIDEHQALCHNAKKMIGAIHKHHKMQRQLQTNLNNTNIEDDIEFRIGSWPGGDRDGNPFVNSDVLHNVLAGNSAVICDFYLQKLGALNNKKDKLNSIATTLAQDPDLHRTLENIQQKLRATKNWLTQTGSNSEQVSNVYKNANELNKDLENLSQQTLRSTKLSEDDITKITSKIEVLKSDLQSHGLHGLTTDIRQNSSVNHNTVAALAKQLGQEYPTQESDIKNDDNNEQQKVDLLLVLLKKPENELKNALMELIKNTEEQDQKREYQLIASYQALQEKYGNDALKYHITANSETFSDMLEVCLLLKCAGVENSIQVMPLIETVPDMQSAQKTLETALKNEYYQAYLKRHNKTQAVMVGYSDSVKGDGPFAATWALRKSMNALIKLAETHDIKLEFFHGRGGTEARGASNNIANDIAMIAPESLTKYRETSQGEIPADAYGSVTQAQKKLAQYRKAVQNAIQNNGKQDPCLSNIKLLDELAKLSQKAYLEITKHSYFPQYFTQSTPFEDFEITNSGSRPSKRKPGAQFKLDDIRAIPYSAAFYQTAAPITAWYGFGTSFKKGIDNGHLERLQHLYLESPFFRGMIDRAKEALQKTDLEVTNLYAEKIPTNSAIDKDDFFEQIKIEYNNTLAAFEDIIGQQNTGTDTAEEDEPNTLEHLKRLSHALQVVTMKKLNETKDWGEASQAKVEAKSQMAQTLQILANFGRFG